MDFKSYEIDMNVFQLVMTCKRTNNANNATRYVKLGKKRRKISKCNCYILSPRVVIKVIIIVHDLSFFHQKRLWFIWKKPAANKDFFFGW